MRFQNRRHRVSAQHGRSTARGTADDTNHVRNADLCRQRRDRDRVSGAARGGGPYPGAIVIQEWWGLNDNIREIADRIAAEGYVALAPDLYHGQATAEPDEAQKLGLALSQERAVTDLHGAVTALQARIDVLPDAIGVTGFCLGGGLALLLAMKNPAVKAVAPFYGVPMGDLSEASKIRGRVLALYAGKDAVVNAEVMETVRDALIAGGVPHEIHVYPESDHAFFNDTRPEVYNAADAADAADAWERLLRFMGETLRS